MAKKTFRKPIEIKADTDAELAQIEAKTKPHRDKVEELKAEKAEQIDYYGGLIGGVRKSKKLKVEEFAAWRDAIYSIPEDERPEAIEAKVAELGLDT